MEEVIIVDEQPAAPPTALATTSFALGISGFFLPLFFNSLAAIITGHMANRSIKKVSLAKLERGFSMTGLILGYISIIMAIINGVLILLFFFFLPTMLGSLGEIFTGMLTGMAGLGDSGR